MLLAAGTAANAAGDPPSASPSPSPTPSASPAPEGPVFYNMGDNIDSYYSVNRDATLYYYFQANTDGTGKAKYEARYGRNLWNKDAVVQIRIPIITKYPTMGNPFSGLGNIELGYSYNVASPTFNHSLEFRGSFATATNNVSSNDTQLKGFYTTKWKWKGGALIYANEYDQSIIVPPGSSWTSYYEGKLTVPEYAFRNLKGLKFNAFYNFRELFDSGGKFKDALGGTLFGNLGNVALSATDSWGLGSGSTALWRYKFEFNLTARL
jgi:hypothetical protein